jgi:hypothetical protein
LAVPSEIRTAARVEHPALGGGGGPGRVREAVDGGIAVGGHQRGQGLHEVEGRRVQRARLLEWTSFFGPRPHFSPLATSSSSTTPLAPSETTTLPSGSCAAVGMKTPRAPPQRRHHLRLLRHLLEVRRADLLLALRHQHEVDGHLAAGAADGVQGGQEGGLGSLLVDGPAPHHRLAQARLVHDGRVPGRRRPLRGVDLLHVVHEVEADGARRARVQRGEDARMAVGRNLGHRLEARLAGEAHHHLAALGHPAVLRRDRRLLDPLLEALHALVVPLHDLGLDGIVRGGGGREARRDQSGTGGAGRGEELASGDGCHAFRSLDARSVLRRA